MSTHIYTSIIANYIPKARVLAHSVKKFHPECQFHLILSDAVPGWLQLECEPFDSILTPYDLGIDNPERWMFKHSLVELSTGVKGFALMHLLSIPDCSEVIYFDPDIVVLSNLERLLKEFERASVLLTPHLTEPEATMDGILDNELSALKHGIYNLGFVGVKNTAEGRRFGSWWTDRLYRLCYDDIPNGIFTDQRWIDLAPAYFSDLKILRDPVYNVCTWNLTHRRVEGNLRDGLTANGEEIVFYHFSGLDSGAQEGMLNKYGSTMPALYELRAWYLAESDRLGQQELSEIPWIYATFDNGELITPLHRKRYRERSDLQNAFPDPYCTTDVNRSYYHWFEKNDESGG